MVMKKPETEPHNGRRPGFLSGLQEDERFDRWVEFLSAVVLSLAAIATAWCGYQSALWGGQQTDFYAQSSAANLEASQLANRAVLADSRNVNLFVEWAAAYSQENQLLADFLFERFPQELKIAAEAWVALEPLKNPDAPSSPFAMAEYVSPDQQASDQRKREAEVLLAQARNANEIGDRYVMLTVLFASVLFFGGVSGKFKSRVVDIGMLVLAFLIFVVAIFVLITFPIL